MKNFFDWLFSLFRPAPQVLKPDLKEIEVSGKKVYIRSLSAGYALSLRGKDLGDSHIFDLLARSICDKNGNSILTPAQAEELGLTTVNQLVKEVMSFNSMGAASVSIATDDLKKTDDLIMNSAGHWEPPQSQ